MRRSLQSLLLLGLSSLGAAVFQDEVGEIDFHHALLGVPQEETTFFHKPRKTDKASLLYTLSDLGVLGAVNPSSGALVWRQQLTDELANGGGFLRAPEGEHWIASAHGSRVEAWDALTGRSIWRSDLLGEVSDLEIMELTESSRKDILVLYEEEEVTVVRRIHGALGTVVWEFRETSKNVPLQISTDITKVFVVSLHGASESYNLHVTALDTATGTRVDDMNIGSKGDVHQIDDVMFVGANSAAPILAWTNKELTKIKINVLGTKSVQEFGLPELTRAVVIHAPHLLQSQTHFLVHSRTEHGNQGDVYHTELKSGKIAKAYELPLLDGPGAFSTSSHGANVYFTRFTEDSIYIVSSDEKGVLAKWPLNTENVEDMVHSVSEVIKKPAGEGFAVRAAGVTLSDDWVLVRNGEIDWTRNESMSGTVLATFAEIPGGEDLASILEEEAETNPVKAYVHRVKRHIADLQYLPAYLATIPERLSSGLFNTAAPTKKAGLYKDSFGFNKLIIGVTRRGRVYALNSGNGGEIVWSHTVFPQANGGIFDARGLFAKDDWGILNVRGANGEFAILEIADGQPVDIRQAGELPPVESTAVVDSPHGQWLLALGPDGQVDEIPSTLTPKQIVVAHGEGEIIRGIKFTEEGEQAVSNEIWQLQMLPGQEIVEIATRATHDPVASIGRVLADRQVSYKYLNPNTIVVASVNEDKFTLLVQLVDTVSGQVLTSQSYVGIDPTKDISCAISENWYACTFFGDYILRDGTHRAIKGYQIVISDLYESSAPNDRGPLGDATNFSSLNPVDTPTAPAPLPWVEELTFVVSQPLSRLSVTQTRQGISNRQLLAYLPEAHSIVGLPRQILDARRPVGREPSAAEKEAEGLFKYAAAIEIDPRTIASHQRDVVGIESILAAPAIVESTSLVVAYGLDIFGTRIAPSGVFDILGNGFNKLALIATVVALFGGVTFLAPMVRRKQINRRWD